jgi:hypothetical protein
MLDRERLIKLLNLTESEYDAEALSAIRRLMCCCSGTERRERSCLHLRRTLSGAEAWTRASATAETQIEYEKRLRLQGGGDLRSQMCGTPNGKDTGRPAKPGNRGSAICWVSCSFPSRCSHGCTREWGAGNDGG